MGLLLRLGPNVITDGTFITLGSKSYYRWDLYYAWVHLLHLCLLLPKWQAVKLIFFAPCTYPMSRSLSLFLDSVEKEESKDPCSQGTKPKNSNQRPSRNKSSDVQVHCNRETIILHGRLPE